MLTHDDVVVAASRLAGVVHRTPVLTSRTLDERTGAGVACKAENLQRVGAFKFRGAFHALVARSPADRGRGVVTYSSGNHAQATALAARVLGVPATILMPVDAPPAKLAATRGYGAEVVTYDRYAQDREALAAELAAERGATLIPPYDHLDVMAGQGTVALELVEQVDAPLEVLVVPVGGGGLLAGCAAVMAAQPAPVTIVGVEPAVRRVGRDALAAGHVVHGPIARTIADGQQTPSLGHHPFEVIAAHVDRIVGVSDEALIDAVLFALERMKTVLEPSGAAGLAALLDGTVDVRGRAVGVVLSGGNIGRERLAAFLTAR